MKTLTSPVTTPAAAAQAGWCELYDVYLPSSITTPWGTTNILRLTDLPGGISFFTPQLSPEPAGTQGNAQAYNFWPIKRQTVKSDARFAADKMQILASNVTEDWAAMLAAIQWYDVPIMIRKVPQPAKGLSAGDCAILFTGQVDAAKISLKQIQFDLSNDLATLAMNAPTENMHALCRFTWGDDQCTAIKYHPNNYKAKTVDTGGSTTTAVLSTGLNEDTGSGGYGTDLVDALLDSAITASSEGAFNGFTHTVSGYSTTDKFDTGDASNVPCNGLPIWFTAGTMPTGLTANTVYYVVNRSGSTFQVAATSGGAPINFTTNGSSVVVNSNAFQIFVDVPSSLRAGFNLNFSIGDAVQFYADTLPSPLAGATNYYAIPLGGHNFTVSTAVGLPKLTLTTTGTNVFCLPAADYSAHSVKLSRTGYWKMSNTADWGTETNGFFQIPAGQDGLKNALLKPYIDFDFGSAVQPKVWRVGTPPNVRLEELSRLIQIFSSSDHSTWKFERYFEIPPFGGFQYDVLLPAAANARYWRICVRSRWAVPVFFGLLWKVSAYAGSRNWWKGGRITFDSTTGTVALRGVSRRVFQSYSGLAIVAPLPAAPGVGDTFKISRGCSRAFNDCGERLNTENFGGFLDLPYQSVIR